MVDSLHNDQQQSSSGPAKVLIVKLADNTDKILSLLNMTKVQGVIVDVNDISFTNANQLDQTNKRILPEKYPSVGVLTTSSSKRRKTDLTCIVCEGQASGYNFNRISCNSCKEFFRRNALNHLEKLKCSNGEKNNSNRSSCPIRFDIKHKCPRCRLLKCFELGMRKDFILTSEEKLVKQQRIGENRCIRSSQGNSQYQNNENQTNTSERITMNDVTSNASSCSLLTKADRSCLEDIRSVYFSSWQSSASASAVLSFELSPNPISAFIHTMNIENLTAMRLINFFRSVPDFSSLDERDRLTLVKYNLISLFYVHSSLTFDSKHEICYFNPIPDSISPADVTFAHQCKSLYIQCYGYEACRNFILVLHTMADIVNNDPTIVQLLLLVMIFLKGWSVDDDQAPFLVDAKQVLNAHLKYTDLLFRYLLEKSSFRLAVSKMTRILHLMLKIQQLSHDYDPFIKSKAEMIHINPLMKSLLHLT